MTAAAAEALKQAKIFPLLILDVSDFKIANKHFKETNMLSIAAIRLKRTIKPSLVLLKVILELILPIRKQFLMVAKKLHI